MIKKALKLSLVLLAFTFIFTGCTLDSSSDINEYLNHSNEFDNYAVDVMPSLNNLGEYNNLEYRYLHKLIVMFESESVALIVEYDDDEYEKQKKALNDNYVFLDKKVPAQIDGQGSYKIPEYEFDVNSYHFNIVAQESAPITVYPKYFGLIGTSNEKKSIAYLYFYDFDLDCISDNGELSPMQEFVDYYFDYEF